MLSVQQEDELWAYRTILNDEKCRLLRALSKNNISMDDMQNKAVSFYDQLSEKHRLLRFANDYSKFENWQEDIASVKSRINELIADIDKEDKK